MYVPPALFFSEIIFLTFKKIFAIFTKEVVIIDINRSKGFLDYVRLRIKS